MNENEKLFMEKFKLIGSICNTSQLHELYSLLGWNHADIGTCPSCIRRCYNACQNHYITLINKYKDRSIIIENKILEKDLPIENIENILPEIKEDEKIIKKNKK